MRFVPMKSARAASGPVLAPRAPGVHRGAHRDDQSAARPACRVRSRAATTSHRGAPPAPCEWLEQLPVHAARAIRDLREHVRVLDARIEGVRALDRSSRARSRRCQARSRAPRYRAPDRLGDRGERGRCARVQERPSVLGLARAGPSSALHRRQDSGSGISPAAAILTYERCSSWAPAACCRERVTRPIRSPVGRSPCESAAATTVPASPSPRRTHASCGPCSISTRARNARGCDHSSSATATPCNTGQTDARKPC